MNKGPRQHYSFKRQIYYLFKYCRFSFFLDISIEDSFISFSIVLHIEVLLNRRVEFTVVSSCIWNIVRLFCYKSIIIAMNISYP